MIDTAHAEPEYDDDAMRSPETLLGDGYLSPVGREQMMLDSSGRRAAQLPGRKPAQVESNER